MEVQQEAARAKYLDQAAALLTYTSPPISSHIRLERNRAGNNRVEAKSGVPESCSACGMVMINAWSCRTTTATSGKRTRKDRIDKSTNNTKTWKAKCLTCGSTTRMEASKPAAKSRKDFTPEAQLTPEQELVSQQSIGKRDAEKKMPQPLRRRAKGKVSSLQSLLAADKRHTATTAQKSSGLSLMDFMKT